MQTAQIGFLKKRWNWRWVSLTVAVLILASTVVYAWMRPNLYRSETRIVVMPDIVFDRELSTAETKDSIENHIQSLQQMLESRTILQRIVDEFNLRSDNTSFPIDDALVTIRSNLEVSRTPSGNILIMAFYASDPQTAQAITKRLAGILLHENQRSQKDRAVEKNEFLDQELRLAESALKAKDSEISDFKLKNLGALPEQAAANMNALNGLHSHLVALDNTLDRARDQQKMLEFRLEEQKRLNELSKSLTAKEKPIVEQPKPKWPPSPLEMQLTAKRTQLAEMAGRYTRLSKEVEELEQQVNSRREDNESRRIPEFPTTALSGTRWRCRWLPHRSPTLWSINL